MERMEWTEARDGILRRLRAEGTGWQAIATELGVTPDVARERGRRIGAPAPRHTPSIPHEDPYRRPLPAGHPRSWGLLTEGTTLAGETWPGWNSGPEHDPSLSIRRKVKMKATASKPHANEAAPKTLPHRADTPLAPNEWGTLDAAYVIARLEEAGRTLLALPHTGPSTRMRTNVLDVVRSSVEGYGWGEGRLRPAYPDSGEVSRMDEAMAWISRIPIDRYVLRRIVGARALINPTTDRHLYPWRKLADALGADHKAVQRWHAQGISLIVDSLNK